MRAISTFACAAAAVTAAWLLVRSSSALEHVDSLGATARAALPGLAVAPSVPDRVAADEVRGIVVTEAGRPLGNVRIERIVRFEVGMSYTAEDGRFTARATEPTWLLLGGEPAWRAAPVLATPGSSVRIVAKPRPTAAVRVLDPTGAPVARVTLRVRPQEYRPGAPAAEVPEEMRDTIRFSSRWDNYQFDVTTDEAGTAAVPLPEYAGALQLTATPESPRLFAKTLRPFDPRAESVVRLEGGDSVSGVVVDASGRPFGEGQLRYEGPGVEPGTLQLAQDGTFETPTFAPGIVTLRVDYRFVSISPPDPIATVPAGSHGVRLVVDPREELEIRVKDPGTGRRTACVSVEDGEAGVYATLPVGEEATLRGLRESLSYVLWIPASDDAGCVYVKGLRVSDGPRMVEATTSEPVDVEVRVMSRVFGVRMEVHQRGVHWSEALDWNFDDVERDADGGETGWMRKTLRPRFPPGTWRFRFTATAAGEGEDPDRDFAVEAVGDSSTPVKVELRPPRASEK